MESSEPSKVVIGSRGSELALWQSNWLKASLQEQLPDLHIEILVIKTKGDRILDSSLSKIGAKGVFTREIDEALLDRRIDISVHSLKDLPTEIPEGLTLGAIMERDDVHDVFISHPEKTHKSLEELPLGARIATGSPRRKCQLLHYRPDLEIVDIRGNVPTRLQKLAASSWDGVVLAKAGLARLNMTDRITETIPTDIILPAVGQGAIAVEVRARDRPIMSLVATVNHEPSAIAARAERILLECLEGGCQVPIGAYARTMDGVFMMDALIGSLDGKRVIRSTIHGDPSQAETLAKTLARTLLKSGGDRILKDIRTEVPSEVSTA
ncbi:MAG: hydroxymethylbilane synthase [Bacteroidota bacterium]